MAGLVFCVESGDTCAAKLTSLKTALVSTVRKIGIRTEFGSLLSDLDKHTSREMGKIYAKPIDASQVVNFRYNVRY